jgi:hypothetical protein
MERSRPKGTDGSDYAYRMTIDNRYKRAAEGRVRFRKFISAQALLQLLKATWACLAALNSEQPSMSLVASCGFGGAAVVVGTFGNCVLEKNSYLFVLLLHFSPFFFFACNKHAGYGDACWSTTR